MNTTKVWVGREPDGYEAKVLCMVHAALEESGVPCHMMANFLVGGHELDLLVVKPDGIFLIESKMVWGTVKGAINGDWQVANQAGVRQLKGGGNENPYQQMLTQFRVLTEWLEAHKQEFLTNYAAKVTHFRRNKQNPSLPAPAKIRSLLTFYPDLPAGSKLALDWKVEPIGFPDLARILIKESTRHVHLTDAEITAMAQLLNLQSWTDAIPLPPSPQPTEQATKQVSMAELSLAVENHLLVIKSPNAWWRHLQLVLTEMLLTHLMQRRNQLRLNMQMVNRR